MGCLQVKLSNVTKYKTTKLHFTGWQKYIYLYKIILVLIIIFIVISTANYSVVKWALNVTKRDTSIRRVRCKLAQTSTSGKHIERSQFADLNFLFFSLLLLALHWGGGFPLTLAFPLSFTFALEQQSTQILMVPPYSHLNVDGKNSEFQWEQIKIGNYYPKKNNIISL